MNKLGLMNMGLTLLLGWIDRETEVFGPESDLTLGAMLVAFLFFKVQSLWRVMNTRNRISRFQSDCPYCHVGRAWLSPCCHAFIPVLCNPFLLILPAKGYENDIAVFCS